MWRTIELAFQNSCFGISLDLTMWRCSHSTKSFLQAFCSWANMPRLEEFGYLKYH